MAISFVTVHHLANYRSANLCLQNDPVPFFPGPFILKMKLMRALVNKNNEGSHLIILLCCNQYCWPFEAENNLKLPFDGYSVTEEKYLRVQVCMWCMTKYT